MIAYAPRETGTETGSRHLLTYYFVSAAAACHVHRRSPAGCGCHVINRTRVSHNQSSRSSGAHLIIDCHNSGSHDRKPIPKQHQQMH